MLKTLPKQKFSIYIFARPVPAIPGDEWQPSLFGDEMRKAEEDAKERNRRQTQSEKVIEKMREKL